MPNDFYQNVANVYQAAIELSCDDRFKKNALDTIKKINNGFSSRKYQIKSEKGITSIVDLKDGVLLAKSGFDLENIYFPLFQDGMFNDPESLVGMILSQM
ncbi:hypothetical protein [Pectobacterium brasiliense]|uniref:hypothetical protein n=1 Tax=Pectobacterium brasiliense TaxID=180957 RepID=UPI0019D35688|nr:hypothetical protein [Pectobacterium brasiliense]MBN7767336.1 hypothetical protein [Pectobacterium brasiliense]